MTFDPQNLKKICEKEGTCFDLIYLITYVSSVNHYLLMLYKIDLLVNLQKSEL